MKSTKNVVLIACFGIGIAGCGESDNDSALLTNQIDVSSGICDEPYIGTKKLPMPAGRTLAKSTLCPLYTVKLHVVVTVDKISKKNVLDAIPLLNELYNYTGIRFTLDEDNVALLPGSPVGADYGTEPTSMDNDPRVEYAKKIAQDRLMVIVGPRGNGNFKDPFLTVLHSNKVSANSPDSLRQIVPLDTIAAEHLAHELGHSVGALWHTFQELSEATWVKATVDSVGPGVDSNYLLCQLAGKPQAQCELTALDDFGQRINQFLDGDRNLVDDTPPSLKEATFTTGKDIREEYCNQSYGFSLRKTLPDGRGLAWDFLPDRTNLMGYFGCLSVLGMGFSDKQVQVMRSHLGSIERYRVTGLPVINFRPSHVSGKCLDVRGAELANGVGIQQYTCHGGPDQDWSLVQISDGEYQIRSLFSNKCFDIPGGSNDNLPIQQYECNIGSNQRFRLSRSKMGYSIQSVSSGKCLDVSGESTDDGTLIQQYPCNGGLNQSFYVLKSQAAAPTARIASLTP